MAVTTMELLELLRKADGADVDFLREGVRVLAQALMDVEVSAQIGAEHSQRNPERTTHRNGYRPRDWDTRVGTIDLQIPRVREGSYLPSFLEPRRRAERALAAVVAQCYVEGVSTRRVEDIAQAMGITSLSKSQVSRVCGELDELVAAWRNRPLDAGPYVFVWLDALVIKVREAGRVVNTAALVATGVNAAGHREILGLELGAAEDGAAWTEFLRGLVARGLSGVKLVISDAHRGLGRRHRQRAGRGELAAVPDPFHTQPAGQGPPARPADGRQPGPHDLRPATPRGRLGPARPRRRAVARWPLR
jgi:putative transposase